MSDIVVFNSGITKQNVYKHAKNVLLDRTLPALVVSLVIFTVIGIRYSGIAMIRRVSM